MWEADTMSTQLFNKVDYPLSQILQQIEMGEIGLPDIQRPFVWKTAKVRDLFDSMYRGFPVGHLLFWTNGLANGHRQIGMDAKQKVPRLLIVDGQQRLTSLYAVLKRKPVVREDYSPHSINIAFRPRDAKFEVTDAAIRRDPEFIPDISELWCGSVRRHTFYDNFVSRLSQHRELGDEEKGLLFEAVDRLYDLQGYQFTALELSSVVNEEEVAEVFVRVNSMGVVLNQADFILTLMSVFWDEGRKELEGFCRSCRLPSAGGPSPFNHFIQPDPDQLLRASVGLGFRRARLQHVYSILRGKDLDTEQFSDERRVQQFGVLNESQSYSLDLQNWHEFLKALVRAGYRHGGMITSQASLIYAYTMFLIGKRDFKVDSFPLRDVIARWFFMTALTGRYTSSPESVMEGDLARLRSLRNANEYVQMLDEIVDDVFTEDFWSINLPNALATSAARSPSLFAYDAALNLLDARVLFSKMKVSELLDPALKAQKSPVERHHLFARGYLKRQGITDVRDVNQIANYALVEWTSNVAISDKAPSDYVPRHAKPFSRNELEEMHNWHALPTGWERMDYRRFLEERRRLMARIIRAGFERIR